MDFEKVNFVDRMLETLENCDKWLNGKDEADKAFQDAYDKYIKAKEDLDAYNEDNVNEVKAYRDDLEGKLIALGVLQVKEEPKVDEVVDDIAEKVDEKVDEQPSIAEFAPEIK